MVGMGLSGTPCEALRALFVDKHYINALFNLINFNLFFDLWAEMIGFFLNTIILHLRSWKS